MVDNRASVYLEDDLVIYRASSLGHCVRALVAERRGMQANPPGDWVKTVMEEGNLHEPDILARVEASGKFKLLDKAQEEVELDIPGTNAIVRGHLDGLGMKIGSEVEAFVVVEAKSMSDAAFKRWKKGRFDEYPGYAWQTSVYAYATGATHILMACKNRNNGELDLWLTRPTILLETIIERVQQVESYVVDLHGFPPCEPTERWKCGFYQLHDDTPYTSLPESGVEYSHLHDGRLDELLAEYKRVCALEDADRSRRDELRAEVLALLGDVTKVDTKHYKVQVRITTSTRLDVRQVRKILTDQQVKQCSVPTESSMLIVDPT